MLSHTACLVGEARGSTAFNGAGGILNIDGQGYAAVAGEPDVRIDALLAQSQCAASVYIRRDGNTCL